MKWLLAWSGFAGWRALKRGRKLSPCWPKWVKAASAILCRLWIKPSPAAGLRLEAADVRALLGAFSLESLDQVTDALQQSDSARMLQVVDDLERNGHNLQHFSRELGRYFRNLLVAKIAGKDTRLIAASPDERSRLTEIAARFSEEDLTRYLQLTLDLFQDLQSSLQPRLHLEIGLVKLVHAGRLVAIEEVLGGVAPSSAPDSSGGKAEPSSKRGGSVARPPQPSAQPVEPDWKQKLHSVLMDDSTWRVIYSLELASVHPCADRQSELAEAGNDGAHATNRTSWTVECRQEAVPCSVDLLAGVSRQFGAGDSVVGCEKLSAGSVSEALHRARRTDDVRDENRRDASLRTWTSPSSLVSDVDLPTTR